MFKQGIRALLLAGLMLPVLGIAQPVAPANGHYATQPGWAELVVSFDGSQRRFVLDSHQGNGRSCSLDGAIQVSTGKVIAHTTQPGMPVCQLQLVAEGNGWRSEVLDVAACRQHCGLQARLAAHFHPLPDACRWSAREQVRASFRQHYSRREYAQALQVLEQLQRQCGGFIDWLEADAIANDLAITQFRLGQPAQCLRTLEKTRVAGFSSEDQLDQLRSRLQLSRLEHQAYLPVARATLYNREKCQQALPRD